MSQAITPSEIDPDIPQSARRVVVLGTSGTIAGSGERRGANIGYTAGTVPVAELLAGIVRLPTRPCPTPPDYRRARRESR